MDFPMFNGVFLEDEYERQAPFKKHNMTSLTSSLSMKEETLTVEANGMLARLGSTWWAWLMLTYFGSCWCCMSHNVSTFAIGWTQKTFQIKGEPKGSHRVSNELGVKCFSADDAHYKNCVAESQRYTMYDISKSQNQSCKISTLAPLIDTILRVYTVCNQVYVLHNCMCKFKGISFARNPVDLRECATPLPKSTKHLMSNLVKLGMLLFL